MLRGSFISPQQACSKCSHFNQCVDTAMNHPELNVKCIHFGYVRQLTDDTIKMVQYQVNEYIREYMNNLIGRKEN